jgi:hypothetical protein
MTTPVISAGDLVERLETDAAYCAERVGASVRQIGRDCAEAAARIQELEAALAPFAEAADVFAREYPAMLEKPGTSCGIRFDALQAARTALSLDFNKGDGV